MPPRGYDLRLRLSATCDDHNTSSPNLLAQMRTNGLPTSDSIFECWAFILLNTQLQFESIYASTAIPRHCEFFFSMSFFGYSFNASLAALPDWLIMFFRAFRIITLLKVTTTLSHTVNETITTWKLRTTLVDPYFKTVTPHQATKIHELSTRSL